MRVERHMRQDGQLGVAVIDDDGKMVGDTPMTPTQARTVAATIMATADQIDKETLSDLDPDGPPSWRQA